MNLSGHTLGTPDHTVEDALRLFADAGLAGAEVIWQDGYRSGLPEGDTAAAASARDLAESLGLRLIALTPYMTGLNSLDTDEWLRDLSRFENCIDAAWITGASLVRVYAGSQPADAPEDDRKWRRLVDALRRLGDYAAERDVVLCVENHFNTMTVSAAATSRLVDEVGSVAVRALYDQANLTFTHDESPEEAIALQAGRIGNVHVKDLVFVDSEREFRADATHRVRPEDRAVRSRVVGEGILRWEEILSHLVATGYDGNLTIEYEYRWHPQDLPAPEIGFARSVSHLRPIIERLERDRRRS